MLCNRNIALQVNYTLKTKQIYRKIDQICGYQRQGVGKGELNKFGPKVQLPCYKIGAYWGCGVQHDDIINTAVRYTSKLLKE